MEITKIAVGVLLFLIGIQGICSEEDPQVENDKNSPKDKEDYNPLGDLILDRSNKEEHDNEDSTEDRSSRVKRQYIGDPYYYGRRPYAYPVPVFIGIGGLGTGPRFGGRGFGGRGFEGRGLGGRGLGGRGLGGRGFAGRGFGGRGIGGRGIGGGRGGGRG